MSDYGELRCVELRCPQCGRCTPKTIGWLKQHVEYACEGCGRTVNLDTDDFRHHIHAVQEAAHKLGF